MMPTKCTNCGQSEAKARCVECVDMLCQECVEAHKRVKVTRSHTIVNQEPDPETATESGRATGSTSPGDVTEDLRQADFSMLDGAADPRFCPQHWRQRLQLYCFTCDQYICLECELMNHCNHSSQFVMHACQSIRNQMCLVLQLVDKHMETAKQSMQDLSSRMQDINAEKVTFKASILRLLQTFVRVVKQRLFQHYAQVMNIYKTEEDQLKRMMQDLMKRMEEGMLRLRQIEEETMDVKRMLARKTELESWSKLYLGQDVGPPKAMSKIKLFINRDSLKAIQTFGILEVSDVPFASNKVGSTEILSATVLKQSDTAGSATQHNAASSPTTIDNSTRMPYKPLPQTTNINAPGPPENSVSHPPTVLASARSNQPSFPSDQSNASNAAPTTQALPSSGFPQIIQQTNHQPYSQQQTSNVESNHQRISNLGHSQSNIGLATTTQSPPTCNYQENSYAGYSSLGTISKRSFVLYNQCPLPVNQTGEQTQSETQISKAPEHPAMQPSYSLGVDPIGANLYTVIGTINITAQNQDSTAAGPNRNFGKPIVPSQPTLVLGKLLDYLAPVNCMQQAISGQLSRASTTLPHSETSIHQNTAAASLKHTSPMALHSPAADYSSSYSSGTKLDSLLRRLLTHNQAVTSVPSVPFTNPSNHLQSPPDYPPTLNSAMAKNPILTLMCENASGALISDSEHMQPGTDHPSGAKEVPTHRSIVGGHLKHDTTSLKRTHPTSPKESGTILRENPPLESSSEFSKRGKNESLIPEPSEEHSVDPEPSGDEPSKDDTEEATSGMPLKRDPCFFSPVVSLVRLPLSPIVPGHPLPRFVIHAGDTEQELRLEEMVEDDMSYDGDQYDYRRPLSAPGSPDINEMVCACCHAPTCDVVCSQCERSFHTDCHVPPGVVNGPDWLCSVCQDLSDSRDPYTSDRTYTPCLSMLDQRRCEHLLLCLLCESCSTTGDPAEALCQVRDRLCHRQPPPYRTFLEFVSDLQVVLRPPYTTKSGAPSIWEGLSALVGGAARCSLQRDPGSQGPDPPPASPTHRFTQQQTTGGHPRVKMEPMGSDTEGDSEQDEEEEEEDWEEEEEEEEEEVEVEEEEEAGYSAMVEKKIKETRKYLKVLLKSIGPIKRRRSHSPLDEEG